MKWLLIAVLFTSDNSDITAKTWWTASEEECNVAVGYLIANDQGKNKLAGLFCQKESTITNSGSIVPPPPRPLPRPRSGGFAF